MDERLNEILNENNCITVFYGEGGTGKTCFMLIHALEILKVGKKVIFIDSGSEQGIKSGMPVAIAPGIAFGYVTDVFPRYSAVRTIFDADFETTVRVGTAEEKALLEGGQNPIVSLIRDKKIVTGDAIVTAGLQFPYGMEVGKIGTLLESQDTFFRKAEIQLSYNLSNIRKIYVILNHFSEL